MAHTCKPHHLEGKEDKFWATLVYIVSPRTFQPMQSETLFPPLPNITISIVYQEPMEYSKDGMIRGCGQERIRNKNVWPIKNNPSCGGRGVD